MTSRKKSVALVRLALFANCALKHCWGQCVVHRTWEGHEENVDRTPRIQNDTTGKQGNQEGTSEPRRPRQSRAQEEQVGKYHNSSVFPVLQPKCSILCKKPITLFLDYQTSTWSKCRFAAAANPSRSHWMRIRWCFQMHQLLTLSVRNCGAAASFVTIIFFKKLSLCKLLLEESTFLCFGQCWSMFCSFGFCFRLDFLYLQILVWGVR